MDYRALANQEINSEPFPIVQYDFRVFISEDAFDRICDSADKSREVGGILVGNLFKDDSGPFVQVDTVIEALHADERGTDVTLTHATWSHIHQQMDSLHADKRIVGWYHTHPGFGIFLSDQDRFIHESFFDLPFQIALVYDPVSREHGVFVWRDSKPWRSRLYWIGPNAYTWDGQRDAAPPEAPRGQVVSKTEAPASDADLRFTQATYNVITNPWTLTVALIGLLLGFLLGQLTTNPASKTELRGQLIEARAQGAKEAVNSLNTDLLDVLRRTLSEESAWMSLDEALARTNQAVEATSALVGSNPQAQAALKSMTDAQSAMRRAQQDRQVAKEMIRQLERATGHSPSVGEREMAVQRTALGSLCAELSKEAFQSGNKEKAIRLLTTAAHVDPANYDLYQQQYESIEPNRELPGRVEGSTAPQNDSSPPSNQNSNSPVASPQPKKEQER